MAEYLIDFGSAFVEARDKAEAMQIAKKLIETGDIKVVGITLEEDDS